MATGTGASPTEIPGVPEGSSPARRSKRTPADGVRRGLRFPSLVRLLDSEKLHTQGIDRTICGPNPFATNSGRRFQSWLSRRYLEFVGRSSGKDAPGASQ